MASAQQDHDESEEEDYMSMAFDQPEPAKPLTSLQRRQQQKREAEERARPKSKAQLAEEEAAGREEALSRSMIDDAAKKKSKGLAMMARMGFKAGGALGAEGNENARKEPINISIKEDRGGVGMDNEKRRRFREAFGYGEDGEDEEGGEAKKKKKVEDPLEYRDRMARERERERTEKLVGAAQRVAEGLAEEEEKETQATESTTAAATRSESRDDDKTTSSPPSPSRDYSKKHQQLLQQQKGRLISTRPLKSINVLWRNLARQREEKQREARMRHDLEQSLSRLPTYEDDFDDDTDRNAVGKGKKMLYMVADDLDEEDPELDAFNELEPDEQLRQLVVYLREHWHYCFWCKAQYPDDTMEGCPGLTEDDHD